MAGCQVTRSIPHPRSQSLLVLLVKFNPAPPPPGTRPAPSPPAPPALPGWSQTRAPRVCPPSHAAAPACPAPTAGGIGTAMQVLPTAGMDAWVGSADAMTLILTRTHRVVPSGPRMGTTQALPPSLVTFRFSNSFTCSSASGRPTAPHSIVQKRMLPAELTMGSPANVRRGVNIVTNKHVATTPPWHTRGIGS